MHPPFGFALFYLRSVAPAKDYLDKLTGRLTARVTTGQIYWGAVPFVLIQIVMVALVISFPQMVMVYKAKESNVDPTKIQIQLQPTEMTPSGQSGTEPTEQQEQKSEDEASKSLEEQFKTAPVPAPESKK
jgi:Tripartite ATP-independent periplasmic transporter, DctM component